VTMTVRSPISIDVPFLAGAAGDVSYREPSMSITHRREIARA
jgi:hypothetical protein